MVAWGLQAVAMRAQGLSGARCAQPGFFRFIRSLQNLGLNSA